MVGNNTEKIDSEVSDKNGMEQIPILEFTDASGVTHSLTQSMAIMEFLEDAFPCNHILPTDALLKGRVRQV